MQEMLEAGVRHERGSRALALEQRVRRHRRPVRESLHMLRADRPSRREHGHELPHDRWATLVGTLGAEFDPYVHLEELLGSPLDQDELEQRRSAREYELSDLEDLRPGIGDYLDEAE